VRLFVAGSGTDVGKTYVTAALIRSLRASGRNVRAVKPLASGLPDLADPAFTLSDPGVLLAAQGLAWSPETLDACSPWRFAAPLSPDMAADLEGRQVDLTDVLNWTWQVIADPLLDDVIVEGVGGVMSPITTQATGLDLAAGLGLPILLVCGTYLGAISHGLTALSALTARGCKVEGLVVNEAPASDVSFKATLSVFRRFSGAVPVHPLRRGQDFPWPPG
jgi:dethiobiotin synthetase